MTGLILGAGGGSADTSSITATAADVIAPAKIIDKDGNLVTGTIQNAGSIVYTPGSSSQTWNNIYSPSLKVNAVPADIVHICSGMSPSPLTRTYDTYTPSSGHYYSSVRAMSLCYMAITPTIKNDETMVLTIPASIELSRIVNVIIRTTAESYPSSSSYRMICAWTPIPLNDYHNGNDTFAGLFAGTRFNTIYAKGATSSPWGWDSQGISVQDEMTIEPDVPHVLEIYPLTNNNKFRGAYLANIWYYPSIT